MVRQKKSIDMNAFHTFICTVQQGSMTNAAKHMGVSVQTISRCLVELENSRQCKLFYKKKPLTLSPAGERYYHLLKNTIAHTLEVIDSVDDEFIGELGDLSIHAPYNFIRVMLSDAIIDFANEFADINVDVVAVGNSTRIDSEGADVAFCLFDEAPLDWVAKRIGDFTSSLYASPQYLANIDELNSPEQLQQLDLIGYADQDNWQLQYNEQSFSLLLSKPKFKANQMDLLYKAAANGLGIANLVDWVAKPLVDCGSLQRVLPQWQQQRSLYLLYPHRDYLPKRVKCFIDFIIPRLEAFDLGTN